MPLSAPPVTIPAPTLALAGWLWIAWLAAAAGYGGTGRDPGSTAAGDESPSAPGTGAQWASSS